jgi:hypothetical protein
MERTNFKVISSSAVILSEAKDLSPGLTGHKVVSVTTVSNVRFLALLGMTMECAQSAQNSNP